MDIYHFFFYNAAGLFTKSKILWAKDEATARAIATGIGKTNSLIPFNNEIEKERYKAVNRR